MARYPDFAASCRDHGYTSRVIGGQVGRFDTREVR